MGGFRTPARAQTRHLRWPASGNLHHAGHRRNAVDFPKADKASRGLVGWDGGFLPYAPSVGTSRRRQFRTFATALHSGPSRYGRSRTPQTDRRALARISFSHGAAWKALISRYIVTILLSGDTCAAEQSI